MAPDPVPRAHVRAPPLRPTARVLLARIEGPLQTRPATADVPIDDASYGDVDRQYTAAR